MENFLKGALVFLAGFSFGTGVYLLMGISDGFVYCKLYKMIIPMIGVVALLGGSAGLMKYLIIRNGRA